MSSPHETNHHFATSTGTADPAALRGTVQVSPYRDDARYTDETLAMRIAADSNHGSVGGAKATDALAMSSPAAPATTEGAGVAPVRSAARLTLSPITPGLDIAARPAEVLKLAIEAFPQTDTWVVFYREILGVDGVVRKLFKTVDELRQWEASNEFNEVHTMLAALRSVDNGKGDTVEPQRMITVRLPVSLHEALKVESDESGLSINKLCITKLLHKMDARFVPQEPGKRRGRKPGPQGKREKKAADLAS